MPSLGDTYITEEDLYELDDEAYMHALETADANGVRPNPDDYQRFVRRAEVIHFYNGRQWLNWVDNNDTQNVYVFED